METNADLAIRKPNIRTDGGPWSMHDQACAVYHHIPEPAVLDVSTGRFHPSWQAQKDGWRLVRANTPVKRFVLKLFGMIEE